METHQQQKEKRTPLSSSSLNRRCYYIKTGCLIQRSRSAETPEIGHHLSWRHIKSYPTEMNWKNLPLPKANASLVWYRVSVVLRCRCRRRRSPNRSGSQHFPLTFIQNPSVVSHLNSSLSFSSCYGCDCVDTPCSCSKPTTTQLDDSPCLKSFFFFWFKIFLQIHCPSLFNTVFAFVAVLFYRLKTLNSVRMDSSIQDKNKRVTDAFC